MSKKKKNRNFPEGDINSEVDDTYSSQKRYHKTKKGRAAMDRARKAYDSRDPQRRKKQKREYMRRMRAQNKAGLKEYF